MGKGNRGGRSGGNPPAPKKQQTSAPPKPPGPSTAQIDDARAAAFEGMSHDERRAIERNTPPAPVAPDLVAQWQRLQEARDAYATREKKLDRRERDLAEREASLDNQKTALEDERKTQEDRHKQSRDELDQRRQRLTSEDKTLRDRAQELVARDAEQNKRDRALDRRERDLNDRQQAIIEREQAAEAGFIERNRASLADLEERLTTLQAEVDAARQRLADAHADFDRERHQRRDALDRELADHRERALAALADDNRRRRDAAEAAINDRRAELDAELARRRAELDAETARRRAELDQQQQALQTRDTKLHADRTDLELERTLLAEDRQSLDKTIDRRGAARIKTLEDEARAERHRREAVEADRDRLFQITEARAELDRSFGEDDPHAILDRLRALQARNAELRRELDARPGQAAEERLTQLEEQLRQARDDYAELRMHKAAVDAQLSRVRVDAAALEQLRQEKEVLELHREALTVAIDELRREVGDLREKGAGDNPFSRCEAMDHSVALETPIALDKRRIDLADFADRIRHRIARDPEKVGKRLYYTKRDIRCFIAGLSMTHLHLLQGISGTGKTSLPRAFARAIAPPPKPSASRTSEGSSDDDAAISVIEVQAGWRDQFDLIGHYNAFQRRFYEDEFLQALYRAGTPRYADCPFIIVLDEMNLSRPEQYFATLLSALERPDDARIKLLDHTPPRSPRRFVNDGRKLPLPANVWFIGTANHDETTVEFADKTYDRAHVMELPRQRQSFTLDMSKSELPSEPVALSALEDAFDDAKAQYGEVTRVAMKTLTAGIAPDLDRRFNVGWGNRLEDHAQRYAPVVRAAGGTMGEAIDHLVATKILRKVRDRYDTTVEDLEALKKALNTTWAAIDSHHGPTASHALLDREIQRKRGGASQ